MISYNTYIKKKWIFAVFLFAGSIIFSGFLLGKQDFINTWTWYLMTLAAGIMFQPLTAIIFPKFQDKGWAFSKTIAILFSGYLTWILGTVFHVRFSRAVCLMVLICCFGVNLILMKKKNDDYEIDKKQVAMEELLFLGVFLFWVYLIGFNPDAYGTEKFMDYGIVQSMLQTEKLPPEDIWYSGETINYYYGGQYYTAFLSQLSGLQTEVTYNLMRAFIPAVMFSGVFALVFQLIGGKRAVAGGLVSAACCVFAGNGHYIIYRLVKPVMSALFVQDSKAYWFPDSTRYIGYNPEIHGDYTIHEFPSYSFILGDLHAHMINIIFVVLLLSILYACLKNKKETLAVAVAAFLIGVFQWTNYWDFVIYSVILGITVFIRNMICEKGNWKGFIKNVLISLPIVFLVPLPFTGTFKNVYKGVGIAQYHTKLYQFLILWGIPIAVTGLFLIILTCEVYRKIKKKKGIKNRLSVLSRQDKADIFIFIISCCALGLILIPELVYVRDIYEASSARANTMFKLTYQAYILFAISSGYIFSRAWGTKIRIKKAMKIAVGCLLLLQLLTIGYFFNGVKSWFHEFPSSEVRKGLQATGFLNTDEFIEDKDAILYIRDHLKGGVILEAHGESYSGFGRVSVITGLPTVAGWYTHEWLWRDDTELFNERISDIEQIYTSKDPEEIKDLLEKYHITCIFYGSREKERYGEENLSLFKKIMYPIYQDENTWVFCTEKIIKIKN